MNAFRLPITTLKWAGVVVSLYSGLASASTVSLPVSNASFESPTLVEGGQTSYGNTIPSWTVAATGINGGAAIYNPPVGYAGFPIGTVPDGNNFAYAYAANISQNLSSTLSSGNYNLTIAFGNPADRTDSLDNASFDLYLPNTSRILASSGNIFFNSIPNGSFSDFSASVDIASSDADLGQAIGIRIHITTPLVNGGPYFAFDNVRLSQTPLAVPVPAAWSLMVGSLLFLTKLMKRS